MKDSMFWLALVMALVPFLEQATADPFVTSKPWLAAILGGATMLARVAYLKYYPTVKIAVPTENPKTVMVNPDKTIVNVR